MDSIGINELLVKARESLAKAEKIKPHCKDMDYEDHMMAAGLYAMVAIAERLDALSKRNFNI